MRRVLFVSLALIAFTLPMFAQAKHPFTFEDMMKLKRVGEPEVSPDGKWVIFQRGRCGSRGQYQDAAHLDRTHGGWAGARDHRRSGRRPPALGAGREAVRVRFIQKAADRRFGSRSSMARRGNATRRYRLTEIATEASGEQWVAGWKNILFTSDVYPECDGEPVAESECNAKKLKTAEQSKVKAADFHAVALSALERLQRGQTDSHLCNSISILYRHRGSPN